MRKYAKKNKCRNIICLLTLVVLSSMSVGCSGESKMGPKPVTTQEPFVSAVITVTADPSLEELKKKDPYEQISANVMEVNNPNKELYNRLFNAIDNMETTVDVSEFPLTTFEKVRTCDSLYEQAGFQFYYVNRVKLSKDGKSVLITYNEKGEEVKKKKETFYSRLSHLVYNVAPENYSPLQKLFSVYDYISVNADYTDNIQDESTHTPYSILMKGKGICGGFAILGYYVLNRVGIPTEYICNEPHAWNMVELDGKKYHTDITWGAGSYGSNINSLRSILMDDHQRDLGLANSGFGGYPSIKGYFRENPEKPAPAEDNTFKVFNELYYEYALDIENNKVYYYDGEGIKRMNLDGKELETVSKMPATYLTAFNGMLYFINTDNRHLYKLQPGKEAELLDDSIKVESISLREGVLSYKGSEGATAEKIINVTPFAKANFDINSSRHQQSVTLPRHQSFKFEIEFSAKMNIDILPKEAVGLVNKEGQPLPIHMYWSEDGRKLTVRPQEFLDKESTVSLYVTSGITSTDGSKTKEMYDITVNIQSQNRAL